MVNRGPSDDAEGCKWDADLLITSLVSPRTRCRRNWVGTPITKNQPSFLSLSSGLLRKEIWYKVSWQHFAMVDIHIPCWTSLLILPDWTTVIEMRDKCGEHLQECMLTDEDMCLSDMLLVHSCLALRLTIKKLLYRFWIGVSNIILVCYGLVWIKLTDGKRTDGTYATSKLVKASTIVATTHIVVTNPVCNVTAYHRSYHRVQGDECFNLTYRWWFGSGQHRSTWYQFCVFSLVSSLVSRLAKIKERHFYQVINKHSGD